MGISADALRALGLLGAEQPTRRACRGQEPTRLEQSYYAHLEALRLAGEVLWWRAQPMRLPLAVRCTYQPDALVLLADRTLEVVEIKPASKSKAATKGGAYWTEDSRIKVRMAAEAYPIFRFVGTWPSEDGGWAREVFTP